MQILIACEFSGTVREAFARLTNPDGSPKHDVVSCDLLPTETECAKNSIHIQGDVLELLYSGLHWDLMIAHPPCTHLAVSGARWFKDKITEQAEALQFVQYLMQAPIEKICIENPVSIISSKIRKPDQIIQPWQFGHGETKATCLWLKQLPLLRPTDRVSGREARVHNLPPSKDRAKVRSVTYPGIARAMAQQWA